MSRTLDMKELVVLGGPTNFISVHRSPSIVRSLSLNKLQDTKLWAVEHTRANICTNYQHVLY